MLKPLIVQNLSCPIILGMDTLQHVTIGESSITLQGKSIPTINPDSSDLLLTGILEVDRNSGAEKEEYDHMAQQTVFKRLNWMNLFTNIGLASQ